MGKYKLINKFTLISSLFIMLILTTGMSNQNNSFSGKIFKNIYIEQVYVGKMKLDEAKDAVDKKYLLKPIYIKYKDKTWCIKPEDIDLSYNIDDAVKNAYSYTRSDSNIENIKRKSTLKYFFTEKERESIKNNEELLTLWTKKESYIKLNGGMLRDAIGLDINNINVIYDTFKLDDYIITICKSK